MGILLFRGKGDSTSGGNRALISRKANMMNDMLFFGARVIILERRDPRSSVEKGVIIELRDPAS